MLSPAVFDCLGAHPLPVGVRVVPVRVPHARLVQHLDINIRYMSADTAWQTSSTRRSPPSAARRPCQLPPAWLCGSGWLFGSEVG
eukprot:970854-Rhodomonas_salina.2